MPLVHIENTSIEGDAAHIWGTAHVEIDASHELNRDVGGVDGYQVTSAQLLTFDIDGDSNRRLEVELVEKIVGAKAVWDAVEYWSEAHRLEFGDAA